MKILFVCTGNTCRSPMAEAYLKSKKISWLTVKSCGICVDGSGASKNAVDVMLEKGIDISEHKSVMITEELINDADRIICLSESHLQYLLSNGVSKKKLSVLGNGITDPFSGDINIYRLCRDEIAFEIDKLFEDGFFSDFKIIPINETHLDAVVKLEKACFSEPWSYNSILEAYNSGTHFFIAQNDKHVMGYAGIKVVLDEGYISNVAVFQQYRRMGVATSIINKIFAFAHETNLAFVTLEVRKSNMGAIELYKTMGFLQEGERRDFYRNPRENALIMTKRFENKNEDIKH